MIFACVGCQHQSHCKDECAMLKDFKEDDEEDFCVLDMTLNYPNF